MQRALLNVCHVLKAAASMQRPSGSQHPRHVGEHVGGVKQTPASLQSEVPQSRQNNCPPTPHAFAAVPGSQTSAAVQQPEHVAALQR
jgi:hypothetical protein